MCRGNLDSCAEMPAFVASAGTRCRVAGYVDTMGIDIRFYLHVGDDDVPGELRLTLDGYQPSRDTITMHLNGQRLTPAQIVPPTDELVYSPVLPRFGDNAILVSLEHQYVESCPVRIEKIDLHLEPSRA